METLGLQLWEKPSGLSHSPSPGADSECESLVKSIQWSRPRSSGPENSGFPFPVQAVWRSCSAAGSNASCLPGPGTAGGGTAPQLAGAKTSGHCRTAANPNSIVTPRLPALEQRCPGMLPRDCHSEGSLHERSPQCSEERGIFVRLIATRADYFMICLFLAQKKYKNLQFTRCFKMLALDSVRWKSNFEKQRSFLTATLAFQPAPVNMMNNNTLTLDLQLKSRTEEHKVHLLTQSQNYWQQQNHDVCNHFTYSLKLIKQWLHLKRLINIMNIIIVGRKRLGLVPVLK